MSSSKEGKDPKEKESLALEIWAGQAGNPSMRRSSWIVSKEQKVGFFKFVRSSKTAQIQSLWLLICLTTFIIIGVVELNQAISNETSSFKPEKIVSVIDYGDAARRYEMPYIYITFRILTPKDHNETGSYWTNEVINDTLSTILETVDFYNMSLRMSYFQDWEKTWVTSSWEEASVIFLGNFSDILSGKEELVACFKLKLPDPDPDLGPFSLRFSIYRNDMTLWDTLKVVDVRLTVSRGEPSSDYLDHRALQISKWIDGHGLSVRYDEKVVKTVNPSSTAHEFSLYTRTTWDTADNGTLDIIIFPNLIVPVWSEYIEFGYPEWVGMMGGYLSILSITFIFFSKRVSSFVDDGSLGILPVVSHAHLNDEKISLLTARMEGDSEFGVSTRLLTARMEGESECGVSTRRSDSAEGISFQI